LASDFSRNTSPNLAVRSAHGDGFRTSHPLVVALKERPLEQSVSVFLPVRNAQSDLESQVEQLLDLLPELSGRFDVLIIDDGSTDETIDVARDLALRYPQVEAVRHAVPKGIDEAIQTGLEYSVSDVVLVQTDEGPMDPHEVRRLWAMGDEAGCDSLDTSQRTATPTACDQPRGASRRGVNRRRADLGSTTGRPTATIVAPQVGGLRLIRRRAAPANRATHGQP
jgi:hypothetical protein